MYASHNDDRPQIQASGRTDSGRRIKRGLLLGCGLVVLLAIGCSLIWRSFAPSGPANTLRPGPAKMQQERQRLDETVWREEVEAQHYEDFFVSLWDSLRAGDDKLKILSDVYLEELRIGQPQKVSDHDWGVVTTDFGLPSVRLDKAGFSKLCQEMANQGYRIVQTEWHHSRFEVNDAGLARSTISIRIDAENELPPITRYTITGDILVQWRDMSTTEGLPLPKTIDASNIRIAERSGPAAFEVVADFSMRELGVTGLNAPSIIVYDLDRDGLSEVLIPDANVVFHNRGQWRFDQHSLVASPVNSEITASLLADFDGDGRPDLLCAGAGFAVLYRANEHGGFPDRGEKVGAIGDSLIYPSVLTAGDVDLDGDLDVWLAQYKAAYHFGQMPTPYYDANDGFPSFLLINDGTGHFQDETASRGLSAKRLRRTYSASLVDLDLDSDLDLAVASDYSGLDLYLNDGGDGFRDVTNEIAEQRHCFGMSLTFGDYNLDQRLDFYMTGMASTTARRLEAMGLGRPEFPDHQKMRSVMGYGNRMYLAGIDGFQQAPFNDQVARTGWSWGSTSFDFDNDADVDIYVANGHRSNQTAKDYCSQFWTHDIYMASSQHDPQFANFFQQVQGTEFSSTSWNGFEHNSLLMNERGVGFMKTGFLMDVAFEFDSRNVVSDDFDGDGRYDLLVVGRPMDDNQAHIYLVQNVFRSQNHWIGLYLHELGAGRSPVGAGVAIEYGGHGQVRTIVTGDSLYSQHATTVHFGLGEIDAVERMVISWSDGSTSRIERPEVDRYHVIEE